MLAKISHLAARIIPEPAEMINASVGIITVPGSGSEHHIPVEVLRRLLVRWIAKPRHCIPEEVALNRNHLAQFTFTNEFPGASELRTRTILRTHLHDALIAAGNLNHPPTFLNEKRERFFDINILPRSARHHRHERMP